MRETKEWLIGFKSLGDISNHDATKFEIQTNKDTYTTIWKYKTLYNASNGLEYREYENSVKDYCRTLGIEQLQYGFRNILK